MASKTRADQVDENGDDQRARAWHYPPQITALAVSRKISPRELMLLGLIHALIHYDNEGRVRSRCYAGNRYLADRIGIKGERHIRHLLTKLRDMGLINIEHKGRKRYITTCWAETHLYVRRKKRTPH